MSEAKRFSLSGYMKLEGSNKLKKFIPNEFGTQIQTKVVESVLGFEESNFNQVYYDIIQGVGIQISETLSKEILNIITTVKSYKKFGGVMIILDVEKNPDYKENYICIASYLSYFSRDKIDAEKTFFVMRENADSGGHYYHYYCWSHDSIFKQRIKKYMKDEVLYKSKEFIDYMKERKRAGLK